MSIWMRFFSIKTKLLDAMQWLIIRMNNFSDKALMDSDAMRHEEQLNIMHNEYIKEMEADTMNKDDAFNDWFDTNLEEYRRMHS